MTQTKRCARCGGTGSVTRGLVINGVCYGCGGSGVARPRVYASRKSTKVIQYALADADGHHLAINTDRATLDRLMPSMQSAVKIVPL